MFVAQAGFKLMINLPQRPTITMECYVWVLVIKLTICNN